MPVHTRSLTAIAACTGSICIATAAAHPLPEAQLIIPEHVQAYDGFGSSIDIDGPYAVIGASSSHNGGSVYVYDTESWTVIREIQGPHGGRFGHAVALDGTTLVVGAYNVPGHGTNIIGKAYLYDILTGEMISELAHGYTQYFTAFGRNVAIEGPNVAVGTVAQGEVSIYDSATGQLQRIIAPALGQFLAISGTTIAVEGNDTIEIHDLETGDHLHTLTPSIPGFTGNPSGITAVAFEGDTLVAGAHLWSWSGQDQRHAGAAFVFDTSTGEQRFHITPPQRIRFGWFGRAVATDGDTVAIASVLDGGSLNVYDAHTGVLNATLIPGYNSNGTRFASGLAIAGSTALIGASDAHIHGQESGGVYRFDVPCSPADAALPIGTHDLADIVAFLTHSTDINGDGAFDLDDIDRFVEAFLNPCVQN